MIDDGSPLSLEGIRAAAAVGRLPDLARRLVAERRWSSIDVLLATAAATEFEPVEAAAALHALCEALAALPPVDRKEAFAELHEAQLRAATALHRRADRTPLTAADRASLGAAGALFVSAEEPRRAALAFEKAGLDERAAEVWGTLGDLERMEACLERHEARQGWARRLREARREFEALFEAGERRAAIASIRGLGAVDPGGPAGGGPARADDDPGADAGALALNARRAEERLCQGHAVAVRLADGRVLRIAALPAVLGRDPEVELPLREPTVSRRHARVAPGPAGTALLEDLGSRAGTTLAGFPLAAPVPLTGAADIGVGATCRLRAEAADGRLTLRGEAGIDRGFWAVLAPGRVAVGDVLGAGTPAALQIDFSAGGPRLVRAAALPVRVAGQLIGGGCDLLHGDHVEVGTPAVRWDVL